MTPSPSGYKPIVNVVPTLPSDVPMPQAQGTEPAPGGATDITPEAVVKAWEQLYYQFPTPGLKNRVMEAQEWAKNMRGEE